MDYQTLGSVLDWYAAEQMAYSFGVYAICGSGYWAEELELLELDFGPSSSWPEHAQRLFKALMACDDGSDSSRYGDWG